MSIRRAKYEEIPKNFDLSKYKVCAGKDLGWWVGNLYERIVRESIIPLSFDDPKDDAIMRATTAAVFDNPELSFGSAEEGAIDGHPNSTPAVERRVRGFSCMQILRVRDFFEAEEFAGFRRIYERAKEAFDIETHAEIPNASEEAYICADYLIETPAWVMTKEVYGEGKRFGGFVAANVDLETPDDELIEDFKRWVAETRINLQIVPLTRSFSASDLKLWSDMRVLAYIDLLLWAQSRNLKIGTSLMGRVLFPDEFNVSPEDRVRKVVAREAKRLMDVRILRLMQAQHIKAERKNRIQTPE